MQNSTVNNTLQEAYLENAYLENADTKAWEQQMKLLAQNPILYLADYRHLPEDVLRWKDDSQLHPADCFCGTGGRKEIAPESLCVGIGKYRTAADGMIYLCTILQRPGGLVLSYSFGVFYSPELVRKALENFFSLYENSDECKNSDEYEYVADRGTNIPRPILLSSRNPIYRTRDYRETVSDFPIETVMTQEGSRGQAAEVSTFFSQLMRRKGAVEFRTWQEGIDWLTMYILKYNLHRQAEDRS